MLTLIRRELTESGALFVIIPIMVALAFVVAITINAIAHENVPNYPPNLGFPQPLFFGFQATVFLLPLASIALGVWQMYSDRSRKISVFLSTLPLSRQKILLARIVSGVVFILAGILLFIITGACFLALEPPLIPFNSSFILWMILFAFAVNLACYAGGLQLGWNPSWQLPVIGSLLLVLAVLFFVLFKGLENETMIVLLVFALAAFTRAWQKFSSAAF